MVTTSMGTAAAPVRAPASPSPAAEPLGSDPSERDPNARNGAVLAATYVAMGGGAAKGLVLDRARALAAFPHARANGLTAKWAAELISGRLTNDVVPIRGGTIKLGARTLTTEGWRHSYKLSNSIGLALFGASMLYGVPNLIDAMQRDGGPGSLLESRAGRTGVFGTLGNAFGLSIMGVAFARSGGSGAARFGQMLQHPLMSNGKVVLGSIALSMPVILNELGLLDSLNRGEQRSFVEVARDRVADAFGG